ncbi:MAG: methylenetetrahydrofolate reductase [NAD(P)H] [Acidobacteria bacterium]|nr:MAG: methylenetetrahydrofolate reductase [NAD(P)H] [Acidobacteriota bacterium]
MRIPDLIAASEEPCFSFEFFPPKTEEGVAELFASVEDLNRLEPSFVSVTYGAGGSTREGTVEITTRIKREYGIETMAHLSVVGETIAGLDAILGRLDAAGIENVLALRGDPPRGEPDFTPPPGGLTSSAELAAFIRGREATARFGIGASCFPEIHPEAASPEADIAFLREKVEAGAEFLISQLFFDNAVYFDWVEQVRDAGIEVPVIPGVLPIISRAGLHRFCDVCKAKIPARLDERLAALDGDPEAERAFGIAYASRQCEQLLAAGAPGIHFFVLNRATSVKAILGAIKAGRPWERTGGEVAAAARGRR